MKNRHVILVVSSGRTATKYFGDLLGTIITGAFSIHEPDVIAPGYSNLQRIRQIGLYETVIGKVIGRSGVRNLSERLIGGDISVEQAANAIIRSRSRLYGFVGQDPIVESHAGWYGLLRTLPHAFCHYRVLAIVRDARTWVTSAMNWGRPYGPRDWITRVGLRRLNPRLTGEPELARHWHQLPAFEKICWTWGAMNHALLSGAEQDQNVLVMRYEDIFLSKDSYANLQKLLRFISAFGDREFAFTIPPKILEHRIHESRADLFPSWREWKPEMAATLSKYCGPLMEKLGYGEEAVWQQLLRGKRVAAN